MLQQLSYLEICIREQIHDSIDTPEYTGYAIQAYVGLIYGYRTDNKKPPVTYRFLNLSEILDFSPHFETLNKEYLGFGV